MECEFLETLANALLHVRGPSPPAMAGLGVGAVPGQDIASFACGLGDAVQAWRAQAADAAAAARAHLVAGGTAGGDHQVPLETQSVKMGEGGGAGGDSDVELELEPDTPEGPKRALASEAQDGQKKLRV